MSHMFHTGTIVFSEVLLVYDLVFGSVTSVRLSFKVKHISLCPVNLLSKDYPTYFLFSLFAFFVCI